MGILSGQNKVLNDGDNASSLIDNVMNCARILNECSSLKEHNKTCKLLVNILGKQSLDLNDDSLFSINLYDIFKNSKSGRLKPSTKSVLVYSPPRGSRGAIIHIFNAVKDFDNVKIEGSGFCCGLSDRYFDVYPGTVAFDITDLNLATDLLSKHLKVFEW